MNDLQPVRLSDLKLQASFLLKEFRNKASPQAAHSFLQLKSFGNKTSDWLLANPQLVRLKHAYTVIAMENGFADWSELKRTVIQKDCLFRPCCVGLVWAWFSNYPEALRYFEKHGGFLLSFWKDFVVCGPEYIRCLNLDPEDENWRSIGNNWVQPKDVNSRKVLEEQAQAIYLSQQ